MCFFNCLQIPKVLLRLNKYFLLILLAAGVRIAAAQTEPEKTEISMTPVFIRNEGQWSDGSLYRYSSGSIQVIFFKDKIRYATSRLKDGYTTPNRQIPGKEFEKPRVIAQVWEVKYLNTSRTEYQYTPEEPEQANVGFVNENTRGSILYPSLFRKLNMHAYDGSIISFAVKDGQLKIDYITNDSYLPKIEFSINGFENYRVNESGALELSSAYGTISDSIPASYHSLPGSTLKTADVRYRQTGSNTFGIELRSAPNPDATLTVDPFYLDYSTYLYGNTLNRWTYIYDVEVDKDNNSYATGYTTDNYPATPGTYDTTLDGGADGFLCKIPDGGGKPLYVIYIGGSSTEYVYSMAATVNGDCFLTGYTMSSNFPVTSGVLHTTMPAGGYSSYVIGIKTDGKSLIYSTYLRGWSWVIDVNESGQVYTAPYGSTPYSITKNINPPGQVGGGTEANIIRLNATGTAILDCVELKGSNTEYVYALTVDKRNQVYAAGWTNSDNLPVTVGQKGFGGFYRGGAYDGFLFKIDSAFSKYLVAKYIGTSGYDYLSAINVNDDEEIFIQGIAGADELPAKTNTFPGGSSTGWNGSVYIMRIFKTGLFPRWTTYITNNSYAWRQRISITAKDECVFAGNTTSTTLPVTADAYQKTLKGSYDAYAGKMDVNGNINYLTYFGGSSTDYLFAVQTKRIGCVTHLVMGGYGNSTDWPLKKEWKGKPGGISFYTGLLVKWRDTLKVDPIDLGEDTVINCDRNYRAIEAGNPGASYRWSTGDTTRIIIVQKPGKYWVNATYGCGFKSDTIVFMTVPSAKPVLKKDTLICNRYGLLLDAKNDTIKTIKYYWNTGDSSRTITATQSGWYKVRMNTFKCGDRFDSIYVTKQYKPVYGIDINDTVVCKPVYQKLVAGRDTLEADYVWNTGDSVREISTTAAGFFKVQVSNRCGILFDSVIVKSDSFPLIRYTTDTLVCDQSSFSITRRKASSFSSVLWSDGNSDTARTFSQNGKWAVKVANGCGSYTDTVKVRFDKTPEPLSPINMLWCDTLKLIQEIYNNTFAKISWSTGDTGRKLNIKDTGLITVYATTGCGVKNANFRVNRGFSPVVVLGNDTLICNNPGFTIIPVKLLFPDNISWNTGATANNISVSQAGTYTLTSINQCGMATDSIKVRFLQSPALSMPADRTFCDIVPSGFSIQANASGGAADYTWSNGNTGLTTAVNSPGVYTLTAGNLCGTVSGSTQIKTVISPKPDLGPDSGFCGTFSYLLDPGNGWSSVAWNNGSNSSTIFVNNYGNYRVTVTDANGCTGSDEISIFPDCDLIWYVPTSFSPNGDGRNEIFVPTMKDVVELKIEIFNRWGQKIWEGNDSNPGWDGTINGEPAPEGAYIWMASYKSNLRRYYTNGSVTLLR